MAERLEAHVHEPDRALASGARWPARCRSCDLVTEDPDAWFYPRDWDGDMVPESRRCPAEPSGVHELDELDERPRCITCGAPRSEEEEAMTERINLRAANEGLASALDQRDAALADAERLAAALAADASDCALDDDDEARVCWVHEAEWPSLDAGCEWAIERSAALKAHRERTP